MAVISSLAALKVFDEIYVLTNRTGGILDSGVTMVFYLWSQAFQLNHAGYASAIAIALLAMTLVFSIFNVRILERGEEGRGMSHASMAQIAEPVAVLQRTRRRPRRRAVVSSSLWYVAPRLPRGHHGLPVLLDADDLAQGAGRPDLLDPAAVHPEQPEPRRVPAGARHAADPDVLPQQHHRRGRRRGC